MLIGDVGSAIANKGAHHGFPSDGHNYVPCLAEACMQEHLLMRAKITIHDGDGPLQCLYAHTRLQGCQGCRHFYLSRRPQFQSHPSCLAMPQTLTLQIQIAQSRYFLKTLGPNVSIIYRLRSTGGTLHGL